MFKFEGKKISLYRDLTVGEGDDAITYPAASLQNEEVRDSIGIVYEADPVRPDDRLFFVTAIGRAPCRERVSSSEGAGLRHTHTPSAPHAPGLSRPDHRAA